jgi:hypothetical protein
MKGSTAWYLGLRGEKQAYYGQGYPQQLYNRVMPQRYQDKPWYQSNAAMMAGGAGLGAGGLGVGYLGRKGVEQGEDLEQFIESGKMERSLDPEHMTPAKKKVLTKWRGSDEGLKKLRNYATDVGGTGKFMRRAGLAGALGGLGLAGYGAYKATQD